MYIANPVLQEIWADRYQKNNETYDEHLLRIAHHCSTNETEKADFLKVMQSGYFFPAGRTMSNAGIGTNLTLNNCFNSNFVEDSIEAIFDKVKLGALTHKKGGGIGYEFSKIRPRNTATSNDAVASGVVSFMEVFNSQTATILQGNRRGANMGILSIYHPDIYDYLESKSWDEGKLLHFNLSIMVDDEFMNAVENDTKIFLRYPVYDEKGKLIKDESKWMFKKEIVARELWDLIMRKAYDTGEYGVFFYDNLNNDNNTHYIETIVGTNPCGEYVSGLLFGEGIDSSEYMGACNLGSLFLHNFVSKPFTKHAQVNMGKLEQTIHIAVNFLDNIIDINKFPHKGYENYQKQLRTIGLGITGLANVLAMCNIKYGSEQSVKFVDRLMNFISRTAYEASINLAKRKGSFPLLNREEFVKSGFINKHISMDIEWTQIQRDILQHGIRNSRIISIAPTGTLSLTYGNNCSSGLEPIIMLQQKRKVKFGGQSEENAQTVELLDYSYNMWKNMKETDVKEDVFVTIKDIGVHEHLNVLKAVAFHTDMSVSKTINIPTEYSFESTKQVYMDAWKAKIKGCTIFRPNDLRQGIFISNDGTSKTNNTELRRGEWKNKAEDTIYHERKIYIGCGKLKLFIGWSQSEQQIQDLYVIRSGSGGCEKNIQALVVTMSGMLRLGGNLFNIEKALSGMGGCNSFVSKRKDGEKLSKGSSCGTAILNEIKLFLNEIQASEDKYNKEQTNATVEGLTKQDLEYIKTNGELVFAKNFHKCPSCGAKLQNAEGCMVCIQCGFSKCG